MDKSTIKAKLVERQKQVVEDLVKSYERLKADADIDENETRDPEDFSHQTESGEMATRFEFKIDSARNDLRALENMPLDSGDNVQEGSVVVTNKHVFFVGVSLPTFEYDGRNVIGISTESPIYTVMRGLKSGDSFSYASINYDIMDVL